MTRNDSTPPVDDGWVDHLRDVVGGVVPPTPADPHDLARIAVRRTRARRAFLVSGGGLTAVAAVAATAFALGGTTTATGELLPGAAVSASADPASGLETTRLRAQLAADGWHAEELEGLTYALPPEIVTSGPVEDEPGETSEMWHSEEDPDSPPFLYLGYYDEGSDSEIWPDIAERSGGEPFDVPGAESALQFDVAAEVYGLPAGSEVPDDAKGPKMLVIEPATGPGAYFITLNLPHDTAESFVEAFLPTLSLD
ncbi:hypothetical protein [Promicromonospora sukumoe]|uniref:hypothetical protein n=1 Tax=Promicromonospora sukumoe TaxID=88382 RepID=UPI00036CEB44|nr:hypothetical protein [Promicromonospora sukumoe]